MSDRPQAIPVQAENIPAEIKSTIQWCTWKYASRNGKRSKIPLQVDGTAARSNTPSTWTDFATALSIYSNPRSRVDGIGFMFRPPFTGVDLDGCRDPKTGKIDPGAQEIVSALNSLYRDFTLRYRTPRIRDRFFASRPPEKRQI